MMANAQDGHALEHGRVEDSVFVTVRREQLRAAFLEAGAESASRRRSAKPSER